MSVDNHDNDSRLNDEALVAGIDRKSWIAIASMIGVLIVVCLLYPALVAIMIHSGNAPSTMRADNSVENIQR